MVIRVKRHTTQALSVRFAKSLHATILTVG
jgi:hypothetical protein